MADDLGTTIDSIAGDLATVKTTLSTISTGIGVLQTKQDALQQALKDAGVSPEILQKVADLKTASAALATAAAGDATDLQKVIDDNEA